MLTVTCGKEHDNHYSRLPNAIAVIGRPFKYYLPHQNGNEGEYEVTVQASFIQFIFNIIPRARMDSESIAHEGERNNYCFSKIQLAGQKYRE